MLDLIASFISSGLGVNLLYTMIGIQAVVALLVLIIPKNGRVIRDFLFMLVLVVNGALALGLLRRDDMKLYLPCLLYTSDCGVNMQGMTSVPRETALTGKSVVITGTLPGISRDEAKTILEQAGVKVGSSVSKRIDYLLVGENPGSKAEKAQALGIPFIQWEEVQTLLKEE